MKIQELVNRLDSSQKLIKGDECVEILDGNGNLFNIKEISVVGDKCTINIEKQEFSTCPFCGQKDIKVVSPDSETFYMMCNECGTIGPSYINKLGAIKLWNTRRIAE